MRTFAQSFREGDHVRRDQASDLRTLVDSGGAAEYRSFTMLPGCVDDAGSLAGNESRLASSINHSSCRFALSARRDRESPSVFVIAWSSIRYMPATARHLVSRRQTHRRCALSYAAYGAIVHKTRVGSQTAKPGNGVVPNAAL